MSKDTTEIVKDIRERPFAFVDLEMTGLDFERHEITEIGLVIGEHTHDEDGRLCIDNVGEYEWKVLPTNIESADPTALKINGYDEKVWKKEAVSLERALQEFTEKVPEAVMVGHNVAFDFAFLEKAFRTTGVENSMHYHKLDTISLAFAALHNDARLTKFSLRELCEYFGIENKDAHTALSDTRATFELYQKLLALY